MCSTYALDTEHQMNHKAGTLRLRTNVTIKDIDYECVPYIYTAVYRQSDESRGEDTRVTH